MILLFNVTLFMTLIITRLLANKFHDFENYDKFAPRKSKAKTIPGFLRRKIGFDFHHIHFGFILLIIIVPMIYLKGINILSIVILAIGLSFVLDQLLPWLNLGNYFSRKMIIYSIIFHLIISLVSFLIL